MTTSGATFARRRLAGGVASICLGAAAVWVLFIVARFTRDAYRSADAAALINNGAPIPELAIPLGIALGLLATALLVFTVRPRWLPAVKGLVIVSSIATGAGLAISSGEAAGVAAFAGLVLWSWWVGGAVLQAFDASGALGSWARAAIETGLGLALLSFMVLAVALLGALSDTSLAAVLIGLPILATLGRIRLGQPLWRQSGTVDSGGAAFWELAALALIGTALVVTFGASLAPQTHFDALHYHFAMPRVLLAEGGFVERPDIIQSYFPLGLEMAYVPAYWLGGETPMTLLHWLFAPLTAGVLWAAADRVFERGAGAYAASLFVLSPLVLGESITASSDLAMSFWLIAALLALVIYIERPGGHTAALAGLCAGLSLTFKIVSALYIMPVAAVFALALFGRRPRDRESLAREGMSFAAAGVAVGLPWLLIRLVQTGNPVFPLFNNVFKSDKWPPIHERFDLWLYGIGHGAGDFGRVLWEVTLRPGDFGQDIPSWSIGAAALMLPAVLIALPSIARDRTRSLVLALAILSALSWFYLSQYHRYGLPAFALMALFSGAVIALLLRRAPRLLGAQAGAILLSCLFAAGLALSLLYVDPAPYPTDFVLGRESPAEYRDRTTAGYAALLFVDSATTGTQEEAAILGYPYNYFVRARMFDMELPREISPFRRAAESGLKDDSLALALIDANIRWLVVRSEPIAPGQEWPPAWLAAGVLSPDFLAGHTEVAFEKYDVVVYRILDP